MKILLCGILIFASSLAIAERPVVSVISENVKASSARAHLLKSAGRANNSAVEVAFVEGSTPIVGLQMDLRLKGAGSVVESCGKLATGHSVICNELQTDILRIIVFSSTNAEISTGTLLRIPNAGSVEIIKESVQLGDINAEAVEPEVL